MIKTDNYKGVQMRRINTENDFMVACATAIKMENPHDAFEMKEWIEEQTFDWHVDEETRQAMNSMMAAVDEAISIREQI